MSIGVLPSPIPAREKHGFPCAILAIVETTEEVLAIVVGADGEVYPTDLFAMKLLPRPGDDLRMAVGWAVETPSWTSLAAERRR